MLTKQSHLKDQGSSYYKAFSHGICSAHGLSNKIQFFFFEKILCSEFHDTEPIVFADEEHVTWSKAPDYLLNEL